ncbi:MAG TPA: 2-oxo-4-hydroxy-4-carboxy-5-ureidoimidazoline decarboxylase [Verrucomicrobiae bacterium]|jgi:OHCU decarboxylase|nr:2-oxo-4-hydroxy-4-carboxy-5-ureidoimidazoline decarboxylase [Verrucomicrobiae bacterium]
MKRWAISEINSLPCEEFVRAFGLVFEHSPWIAELAWERKPFANLEQLHRALCQTVENSGLDRQLSLIRAHPDLVGRLAQTGQLTKESTHEQASAGLDRLTKDEVQMFQKNNTAYKDRFGFPFIICARLNKKEAILAGFELRLKNSRDQEVKTALEEISKIAELRLRDLIDH